VLESGQKHWGKTYPWYLSVKRYTDFAEKVH